MELQKTLGRVEKSLEVSDSELALINAQALRPLAAEEVYAFRFAACDTSVDRDYEHFSKAALESLAKLFVGRPLLRDHRWSADAQTARIYAAHVEESEGAARLILRAYMRRSPAAEETIQALEAGILREVSVGCAMGRAVCSICGVDKVRSCCAHQPGREYGGVLCTVELDEATDAYECSLVAVPAQREAGVVKRYGGEETRCAGVRRALAWLKLEEQRF